MGSPVRAALLPPVSPMPAPNSYFCAPRILNQIVSLVTLRDAGKAREIPVFGFVKDVFVIGVLDEIERRVLPGQEKEGTDASNQADSEKISFYFQSKSPAKPLQTGLFLVDSKTRRSRSKPRAEHTVAVRYFCWHF